MFDDVRPHSQGRTFIFPVGFGGGGAPSQPSPREGVCSRCVLGGLMERPPLGRALKKSLFFMTKTENAYDL